ncbi:unnamed protein product [Prorocentrum cordatum]|uniref:Uncharacterized protein n=1 Tax=Prorocentrum cordatum TaxID=2364126 RepID=A0ABN9UAV6_9DINO|nr:unnamed protein product [Polarella glacialis]
MIGTGHPIMALALVATRVAHLRPAEAMRWKEKEMDQHLSKVNLFEESLVLDSLDLPWLGALLAGLRKGQPDRLFLDFKHSLLGPTVAAAAKRAGLDKLKISPYHTRHSGPSHDILH